MSLGILINSPVLWWQQYWFRHRSYIPVCEDILLTYKTKPSYVGTTQDKHSNLPQTRDCSLSVIGKGSAKWWKKHYAIFFFYRFYTQCERLTQWLSWKTNRDKTKDLWWTERVFQKCSHQLQSARAIPWGLYKILVNVLNSQRVLELERLKPLGIKYYSQTDYKHLASIENCFHINLKYEHEIFKEYQILTVQFKAKNSNSKLFRIKLIWISDYKQYIYNHQLFFTVGDAQGCASGHKGERRYPCDISVWHWVFYVVTAPVLIHVELRLAHGWLWWRVGIPDLGTCV